MSASSKAEKKVNLQVHWGDIFVKNARDGVADMPLYQTFEGKVSIDGNYSHQAGASLNLIGNPKSNVEIELDKIHDPNIKKLRRPGLVKQFSTKSGYPANIPLDQRIIGNKAPKTTYRVLTPVNFSIPIPMPPT